MRASRGTGGGDLDCALAWAEQVLIGRDVLTCEVQRGGEAVCEEHGRPAGGCDDRRQAHAASQLYNGSQPASPAMCGCREVCSRSARTARWGVGTCMGSLGGADAAGADNAPCWRWFNVCTAGVKVGVPCCVLGTLNGGGVAVDVCGTRR